MQKFYISKLWNGKSLDISSSSKPIEISMRVHPIAKSLELQILAPYFGTSTIPDHPIGRCPRLYDFEVVEVFIASSNKRHQDDPASTPYFEVIVGPHGHYLAISHTGQGKWSECNDTILFQNPPPRIQISADQKSWTAVLHIPYDLLPEPVEDLNSQFSLNWKFNAYAIHGNEAERVYMAMNPVPGETPNFHQLKHFVPLALQDGDPLQNYQPREDGYQSASDIVSVSSSHREVESSLARINTYGASNDVDSVTKVYADVNGSGLQSHIINYYISPDYNYNLMDTNAIVGESIRPSFQSIESLMSVLSSTTLDATDVISHQSHTPSGSVIADKQFHRQKSGSNASSVDSATFVNKENHLSNHHYQHLNLKFVNTSSSHTSLDSSTSHSHCVYNQTTALVRESSLDPSEFTPEEGDDNDKEEEEEEEEEKEEEKEDYERKETLAETVARLYESNSHICGYIFQQNPFYFDTLMNMNELFELHLHSSEKILLANLVDRKFVSNIYIYICHLPTS